jgi:hypothetical protein
VRFTSCVIRHERANSRSLRSLVLGHGRRRAILSMVTDLSPPHNACAHGSFAVGPQ